MFWYCHLFKNFLQFVVIHTVKGFSVVNEANIFLEFSVFFSGIQLLSDWKMSLREAAGVGSPVMLLNTAVSKDIHPYLSLQAPISQPRRATKDLRVVEREGCPTCQWPRRQKSGKRFPREWDVGVGF